MPEDLAAERGILTDAAPFGDGALYKRCSRFYGSHGMLQRLLTGGSDFGRLKTRAQ